MIEESVITCPIWNYRDTTHFRYSKFQLLRSRLACAPG